MEIKVSLQQRNGIVYFSLPLFQLYHLQHPNIARFIGVVIENGDNRVLMEYCPRGSLQVILRSSK